MFPVKKELNFYVQEHGFLDSHRSENHQPYIKNKENPTFGTNLTTVIQYIVTQCLEWIISAFPSIELNRVILNESNADFLEANNQMLNFCI
jgi:hypothetical protein